MSERQRPIAPVIEILDGSGQLDAPCVPTDVRINGESLLCAAEPVVVDRIDLAGNDLVRVTVTFIARRLIVGHADA